MTYQIKYSPSAQRDLGKLPPKIMLAALAFIENVIAENPRRLGKPLSEPYEGLWSARRLDYRIVYEIDDETIVVEIVRVGHRAHVYRPR